MRKVVKQIIKPNNMADQKHDGRKDDQRQASQNNDNNQDRSTTNRENA